MNEIKVLSVTQVADKLMISNRHVRRLIAGGVLRSAKVGAYYVINVRDIEEVRRRNRRGRPRKKK